MSDVRTLIVDDDYMVASIHSEYTQRVPGFEVVGVANSGTDALAAVERLRPDLVVLDVYLPDMSGLEVLQALRGSGAAVDVIMVTAAKDAASLREAMAGGALRYIVKPFDFVRFRDTLSAYRRFRGQRSGLDAISQEDVDRLYSAMGTASDQSPLPKGLNRPTLSLVVGFLRQQAEAISAQEAADGTGISRGTARRYLEYLESRGQATLELRYGAAGRPEHRYRTRSN
jgi:two-component system CitB family response regulator